MTGTSYLLRSAGQRVVIESTSARLSRRLQTASGHSGGTGTGAGGCDVRICLESSHRPFSRAGMVPVTRGAWTDGAGTVVFDSVGGSGHTQCWTTAPVGPVRTRSRWHPSPAQAAAGEVLRRRQRALEAEVLLHYPILWTAARHGLAPLHVSVLRVDDVVVVLAGPGGLGKSTMVSAELAQGAVALCDNLAVTDGVALYGLAEPLRVERGTAVPDQRRSGHAMHHRQSYDWGSRPAAMVPDVLVVVRRGRSDVPTLRQTTSAAAARSLVAGTFAAGELSRFWPLAATLALATGEDQVLPTVEESAARVAARLPCFELELGRPGVALHTVLATPFRDLPRSEVVR
ncbi:MAG: hypothetical protein ACTHJH_01650 [Marmoricola sp.]